MKLTKKKDSPPSKDAEEVDSVEEEEEEEAMESLTQPIIVVGRGPSEEEKPPLRTIGLIGDLDEEKASEILSGMLMMRHSGIKKVPKDLDDLDAGFDEEKQPIEFVVSTHGGSASEMFGIYDMMHFLQSEGFEVCTVGIGKVMSAGVLLLASGTKGKRRIGKHTRVMIHQVSSGHMGTVSSLENEVQEIKNLQEVYIGCLAAETDMTKRHIKKLFNRKEDVYLSAEQAVEFGIADEIF
jgi:ATP-dependent Clp endopeptidase proteolytic subunit ClpP